MRSLTQKIIDVICFIGGTSIFVFTLFDFSSSSGGNYDYRGIYEISNNGYCYYYTVTQNYLLAIGASLIVLGFLIRDWRKKT